MRDIQTTLLWKSIVRARREREINIKFKYSTHIHTEVRLKCLDTKVKRITSTVYG